MSIENRIGVFRLAMLLGTAVLVSSAWSAPALAQDGAAEEASSNDIIVTAQRRSEALEDVPMTVSVLTADTLASAGVNSVRDLANVTTGLQLGQGGFTPQPAIRGVTTVINGIYENNIAVYVDDVYQSAPQAINIDLPNTDNVQVLKGPQGTLYGRNATGGAILIKTVDPTDVMRGKAELTYARFDDKRASAYIAGPLSEKIGFSLAGYVRRSDGYNKLASRTTAGQFVGNAAPLKQEMVRLKLRGEFSESFSATLGYSYTRVSDPRGILFTPYENVAPALAPAYDRTPREPGKVALDLGAETDINTHEASLKLELDTGIGNLKSISALTWTELYNAFDFDGTFVDTQWSDARFKENTFQQALDYSIDAIENVDLLIGGTYFNYDQKLNPSDFYVGSGTNAGLTEVPLTSYTRLIRGFFRQRKEAWGLYADVTFHATDRLSINAGGRYSDETGSVAGTQLSPVGALVRVQATRSTNYSKFTPRASIRFEISPRNSIYAAYSQGFRSGTFNNTQPANSPDWLPARQEVIDAFEVGFKTAGSNFRFDAAAFYYDYKDLQISSTTTGEAGNPMVTVVNAPKAKVKGIEASFDWQPIENFKIRGGAMYLRARFGDGVYFNSVGVANGGPGGGIGLNTNTDPLKTFRNVNQLQNISGLQMSRAPDFTANLGMEFQIPNGEGGLKFAANMKYTDSYVVTNPAVWGYVLTPAELTRFRVAQNNTTGVPADQLGKQRFRQGSYVLLNASITWTEPGGHFYVQAFGTNLTNKRYLLHYTGTTGFGSYSPLAEPLTFGGRAGYKF